MLLKLAILLAAATTWAGSPSTIHDSRSTFLERRHPWQGFGAGSWVERKTTVTAGAQKTLITETWTVEKVEKDAVTLVVETTKDGATTTRRETVAAVAGPASQAGEEKGKRTVVIDGEKMECVVREEAAFVGPNKFTAQKVIKTRLVCADAPTDAGVIEEKVTADQMGLNPTSAEFRLTTLKAKVKAGKGQVTCWATEAGSQEAGSSTTTKEWRSHEVPGALVKMERTVKSGGATTVTTVEVTGFEKK